MMKFQLLPNYFKTIGIILFIIFLMPSFLTGFIEGISGNPMDSIKNQLIQNGYLGVKLSNSFFIITEAISIIGLIICLISKEKILDEYLIKLRMESIQMTFIITLLVVLLTVITKQNWKIDASYLLYLQIFGFFTIIN